MPKLPIQQAPDPIDQGDLVTKSFLTSLNRQAAVSENAIVNLTSDWAAVDLTLIPFDNYVINGGLVLNGNGTITLKAGRKYALEAQLALTHTSDNNAFVSAFIYDNTNNAEIGSQAIVRAHTYAFGDRESNAPNAYAFIEPSTDIEVGVRTNGIAASSSLRLWTAFKVHEVGAAVVQSVGGLEYMDTINVTAGGVSSVSFGEGGDGILGRALDGNVDEVYELFYFWPKPNLTLSTLQIHPDGVDVGANSNYDRHISNGGTSNGTGWALQVVGDSGGGTSCHTDGHATIFAKTGKKRRIAATNTSSPGDANEALGVEVYSTWHDTVTNITGLTIIDEAADLPIGSQFILFRRRAASIRSDSADTNERRVTAAVAPGSATEEYTTGHTIFGGSAIGLSARIEDAVTAGDVTVNLKVGGTTVLTTVLDTTNPMSNRVTAPLNTYKFGGDVNISVEIVSTGYDNAGSVTSGITVVATVVTTALMAPQNPEYQPGHLDGLEASWVSNTEVSIAAGSARSANDAGNIDLLSPVTADITVSGVGGLDKGSEANDTWYAIYVIADSRGVNSTAALLSTDFAIPPTLPAGYDLYRRVGAVRNRTNNFQEFEMRGKGRDRIVWTNFGVQDPIVNGGTAGTYTQVDGSVRMPPSSTQAFVRIQHQANSVTSLADIRPLGSVVTSAAVRVRPGLVHAGGNDMVSGPYPVMSDSAQQFEYQVSSGIATMTITAYVDSL